MIYTACTAGAANIKVTDRQGNAIGFAFEADTDKKTLKCYIRDPTKPDSVRLLVSNHKMATVELKRSYNIVDRNTGEILHEVRVDFDEQCGQVTFDV